MTLFNLRLMYKHFMDSGQYDQAEMLVKKHPEIIEEIVEDIVEEEEPKKRGRPKK